MSEYFIITDTSNNGSVALQTGLNGDYIIEEFIINNTLYNVNSFNNKIYFDETATLKTATLTLGYYTPSELVTEIKTQMDSAGANTYTVTYNSNQNTFSFSSTGNFKFVFGTNQTNSAYRLLGKNAIDDVAEALTNVSDNVIDLTPNKIIYVNLPEGNIKLIDSTNTNYTFYVSTVDTFGSVIRKDFREENDIILTYNNKKNITYSIRDNKNNLLETNGAEWYLILRKV